MVLNAMICPLEYTPDVHRAASGTWRGECGGTEQRVAAQDACIDTCMSGKRQDIVLSQADARSSREYKLAFLKGAVHLQQWQVTDPDQLPWNGRGEVRLHPFQGRPQ